ERVKDRLWISGALLAYLGECGNWFALSQISPTIVTPLGIISVVTNVCLAHLYLNEKLSQRQITGYGLIMVAVLGILLVAPKEHKIYASVDELIQSITQPFALFLLFLSLGLQSMFLWIVLMKGTHRIFYYVAICSFFGAYTVSCSKLLSMHIQVEGSKSMYFPILMLFLVLLSVLSQEWIKQHAITKFPISQFHPYLYAGFNTSVVLSSVFFFHEIPSLSGNLLFVTMFVICMTVIVRGIQMTHK
ncbi:magnesium transporter, partial [Gorgonomyces haynaldii]